MRIVAVGAGVALALVLAAGCRAERAADPPSGVAVDWTEDTFDVDLGGGFRARECEGDAPLVCIERSGVVIGFVELLDFPAGDGRDLADRVEELYRSTVEDRARGCPPGYVVETVPPVASTVGGAEALRYGFTGTLADGRPSERMVAWIFERDGFVSVVHAAAYDPDGCLPPEGGGAFTTEDLAALEPHLEALVAGSILPEPA